MQNKLLIPQLYTMLLPRLVRFMAYRINDEESARDLAQDVFLKLLESHTVIFGKEAGEAIVFRIARNVVNDWLRRHYLKEEAAEYLAWNADVCCSDTESHIYARDIERLERTYLSAFPARRKAVYSMRRFEGMDARQIASRMGLSRRTVENHILAGNHAMRDYIRMCI